MAESSAKSGIKIIAQNKKAFFDYEILERFEAGLVLQGTEVKSLRQGSCRLKDAYAQFIKNELFLRAMHIPPYAQGNRFNPDPERLRKLLLHKHTLRKLVQAIQTDGLSLVPLKIYFKHALVKVEIALVRGKHKYDKRQSIIKREAERKMAQALNGRS